MRWFRVPLVFLVLVVAAPAEAHVPPNPTFIRFEGARPCAVACSYWIDSGFTPCETPFPPGSYVDQVTVPAPTPPANKGVVLDVAVDSVVDWDTFLCSSEFGVRLDYDPGCCYGRPPCESHLGPAGDLLYVGCHQDLSTYGYPLLVGQRVWIRAYNFSDPLPAEGAYGFHFI